MNMATEIDDIGALSASDTDTFQLRDPNDEPLTREGAPITVTVFGPGSDEHARATTAQSNKQLKRLRKRGDIVLTATDVAEDAAEFLTAITKEFGNLKHNGEIVGADRSRIRALYLDRRLSWIGDQVNDRVKNWENFMNKSEKS
jgi:hypothetical protein